MIFDGQELAALLGILAGALEGKDGHSLVIGLAPACDCGCGRPAGIAVTVDGTRTIVTDAGAADVLIGHFTELRAKLWGPPHAATAGNGAADVRRN